MEKLDFSEKLEYCEFRTFNLMREKRRIERITNVLNNIAASKNSLIHKLYVLEYSLFTINDKAVMDMDYEEAYDYYVYRDNSLSAEMLQVEEEYQNLIKQGISETKIGRY